MKLFDIALIFGIISRCLPTISAFMPLQSPGRPLSTPSRQRWTMKGGQHESQYLPQSTHLWAVIPQDLPSLLTAFDTFDGSTIVDPVVVSNTFWGTLGAKILSLIIGQIIATVVFSVVVSIAASQLSGIAERTSKGIVEKILGPPPPKLRMPPPEGTPTIDLQKLVFCLAIDILGTSSEFLPIVGELTDVIYAPLAATLLRNLYGSNVVFLLEFAEEILPFTDIIPLATICWVVDTLAPSSGLAKLLGLGDYSQNVQQARDASSIDVIDTTSRVLPLDSKASDRQPR